MIPQDVKDKIEVEAAVRFSEGREWERHKGFILGAEFGYSLAIPKQEGDRIKRFWMWTWQTKLEIDDIAPNEVYDKFCEWEIETKEQEEADENKFQKKYNQFTTEIKQNEKKCGG